MSGMRFCYAGTGIQIAAATASIYDAQFVKCGNGCVLVDGALLLGNALFANTKTNLVFQGGFTVNAQNVTFVGSTFVATCPASPSACSLFLTNCILENVVYFFSGAFDSATGDYNGFYANNSAPFGNSQFMSPIYPFQAVGAAYYYLANGCNFFNRGTPNIDPALLTDLRKKTTHPPQLYAAASVPAGTTWPLQAPRDTGCTTDLGYHYDPLDYCVSGQNLNGTLTLAYRVAVGIYGPYGFKNGTLASTGTPLTHNHLSLYSAVQEQPIALGANASATYFMNSPASTALQLRFTDLSLAGSASFGGGAVNGIALTDCYLLAVKMNMSSGYYLGHLFTNNIIERCYFQYGCLNSPGYPVTFCKNLLLNTSLSLGFYGNASFLGFVTLMNNLFVNGSFLCNSYPPNYVAQISNNGYYNTSVTSYGANPKLITTLDFQPGPLGSYYYPITANGNNLYTLIDAGSGPSSSFGLDTYTTQEDLAPDSGTVDIGFHYHRFGQVNWIWASGLRYPPLVSSSPAIGNNGIIYVAYYNDDYCNLYAINPTTHGLWTEWSHGTTIGVFSLDASLSCGIELGSSPMLGKDGSTIYLGSADSSCYATLYAVNTADGTAKWSIPFSTGAAGYFSTTALASDGTVYVGNAVSPDYYALIDNTSQAIIAPNFPTQLGTSTEVEVSAAIGIDGITSYVTTDGDVPQIYAVTASGMVRWFHPLQGAVSGGEGAGEFHLSPSIGADGTVYLVIMVEHYTLSGLIHTRPR